MYTHWRIYQNEHGTFDVYYGRKPWWSRKMRWHRVTTRLDEQGARQCIANERRMRDARARGPRLLSDGAFV